MSEVWKKILLILCAMFLTGTAFLSAAPEKEKPDSISSELHRFLSAIAIIRENYVDPEKVTYKNLFTLALRGLLRELDPYSTYETEDIFNKTKSESMGERVGIGISVTMKQGMLNVQAVDPESPAQKAGILAGDLIQQINGDSFSGKTLTEAAKLLLGAEGEPVALSIYRPSTDKHLELNVTRSKLHIRSVTGVRILDPATGTGYLRITQFGHKTPAELDEALKQLRQKNLQLLIIDLRDNPGGLVYTAAKVCSRFIPEGKTVVSLIGRDEKIVKQYQAEKSAVSVQNIPVALIVNSGTASAAEIMTACLRDSKRGIVIGEQTFGKGVVQTLLPFGKKEALRITTATFHSPDGHSLHGKGITPDIVIRLTPAQRIALSNQLSRFPGIILPQTKNPVRDIQLERAAEVLKAVKLFRNAHK